MIDTDAILEHGITLWNQASAIWLSGGWAMVAIAVNALVIFALGMNVQLRLRGMRSVPERTWRHWIDHPGERRGAIGDLLDAVTGGVSLRDTATLFERLRTTEIVPFERDLRLMRICVSAAPLLGLLGTVSGMLTTFGALSSGAGGEKTMQMVAGGISEALITTETGLVIAIAGLFFQYHLARKHERYCTFLAHLETVCNQKLYKRLRTQEAVPERTAIAHGTTS